MNRVLLAVIVALAALLLPACAVVNTGPGNDRTIQNAIVQASEQDDLGLVRLADGDYGDQAVDCPPNDSRQTLVVPQHKNKVVLHQLISHCDRIIYSGLIIDAQNVDAKQALDLSGDDATLQKSVVRNVLNEKNIISGTRVTVKDNTFEHVWMDDAGVARGVHQECIFAVYVPFAQILRNHFEDCGVMDVMFTNGTYWEPPAPHYGDGRIEGNFFGAPRFENHECCHYYPLLFHGTAMAPSVDRFIVRNNHFEGAVGLDLPWKNGIRCGNTGTGGPEWNGPC